MPDFSPDFSPSDQHHVRQAVFSYTRYTDSGNPTAIRVGDRYVRLSHDAPQRALKAQLEILLRPLLDGVSHGAQTTSIRLNANYDLTMRLFALGKLLGLWSIIGPEFTDPGQYDSLELEDIVTLELAGHLGIIAVPGGGEVSKTEIERV